MNKPQKLKATCTVNADECIKLKELFNSKSLLAMEKLDIKQATNGFGMTLNGFDVTMHLIEIIPLEKPEIEKVDDMNLENTKVYTTDPEVISKYAELCGKSPIKSGANPAGYYNGGSQNYIYSFAANGFVSRNSITFATIYPDQINALYDEKFGKVETPEEVEVFDIMAQDNEQLQNYEMGERAEWKNGDECIFDSKPEIGREKNLKAYFGCYNPCKDGLVLIFDENGSSFQCFESEISRPETPQQREERESKERKLEIENMLSISINFNNTDLAKTIARIIDDAGYRKQKDGEQPPNL